MSAPTWITDLEDEAGGKPVLLVEGDIDERVLIYFLMQVSPNWEAQFKIHLAGSKENVFRGVKTYHPEWGGIVDSDGRSIDYIQANLKDVHRVRTLPRFCLENYFCVPDELWSALPPGQKAALANDVQRLAKPILAALPDWVAHGAMWRVIHGRRQDLLYEHSFPAKLDREPVTDRVEIRQILEGWHAQLDPDLILEEYDRELAAAQTLNAEEQLKTYVHGKKFFKRVVVQTLNRLFPQNKQRSGKWQEDLTRTPAAGLPLPADLKDFLADVVELFTGNSQ